MHMCVLGVSIFSSCLRFFNWFFELFGQCEFHFISSIP